MAQRPLLPLLQHLHLLQVRAAAAHLTAKIKNQPRTQLNKQHQLKETANRRNRNLKGINQVALVAAQIKIRRNRVPKKREILVQVAPALVALKKRRKQKPLLRKEHL